MAPSTSKQNITSDYKQPLPVQFWPPKICCIRWFPFWLSVHLPFVEQHWRPCIHNAGEISKCNNQRSIWICVWAIHWQGKDMYAFLKSSVFNIFSFHENVKTCAFYRTSGFTNLDPRLSLICARSKCETPGGLSSAGCSFKVLKGGFATT